MWKDRLHNFASVLESDARSIRRKQPGLARHQHTIARLARTAARTPSEVEACRMLDYLMPEIRSTLVAIMAGSTAVDGPGSSPFH